MVRTPSRSRKTASPRRPNGLINLDAGAMSTGPSLHLSNTPRFKRWHVPLRTDPPPGLPSPPKFAPSTFQSVEAERLRTELSEARRQNHELSESNKRLYTRIQKLQAQLARQAGGPSIIGLKTVRGLSKGQGLTGKSSAGASGSRRSMVEEAKADGKEQDENCDSDLSKASLMIPEEGDGLKKHQKSLAASGATRIPSVKVTPAEALRTPLSDATNRSPQAATPSTARIKLRSSASSRVSFGVSASPRSTIRTAGGGLRKERMVGAAQ